MEVLKQSRGHLKGAITRAHNFALNIPADAAVEAIEIRLERLSETWKDFCINQNELFKFHDEEGYGDPEVDFEMVESKYFAAKGAFVHAIRRRLPNQRESDCSVKNLVEQQAALLDKLEKSASPQNKRSCKVELPVLKLEPFSGDYREWPCFRDMFLGSIDCNDQLSSAQKFRYLRSFLRDEAAKLISHLNISDSNYEQAWEKLERRYNKPLYMISAYIDSFIKLPTITSIDTVNLRKLVDNADEIIRGLAALKCEGRDPWLIFLLLNKTDSETRKAWALEVKDSEDKTFQDLLDFLDTRCNALLASESKTRANRNASRSSNVSNNIKSLAVAKSSCPKCKENHLLPQCSLFKTMNITSRRNFVRDERLCFNCLGTKHSASRCRSNARFSFCHTRHHTLVHLERPNLVASETTPVLPSSSNALTMVSKHITKETRSSGILPTVVVNIIDIFGKSQSCRVLLDTGSQVSFVTDSCVKRLGLRRRHARLPISGISSLEAGVTHGAVTLKLHSTFESNSLEVEAFILKNITSPTPMLPFDFDHSVLFNELRLADPGFNKPGSIDILLGSDKAWTILRDGHRSDENGHLIAHNTMFGWVITGSLPDQALVSLHVGVDQDLDILLKSFWEIEEVPHHPVLKNIDIADEHFSNTFSRAPDNKYVVELPFRQREVEFGNTVSGALSRLLAMERRFSRCEKLRLEYNKFMQIYLELGQMELIPENEVEPTSGKVFYLPHQAVVTSKLRVVFDGSHRDSNGLSLNEMLYPGPPLQRNLINVCLRFRFHKYVFCADIVKMFRQIWVDLKHRDFQRIVWRSSPTDPISHYRLCTVTYGTSSAPFLAMRVLRQLAFDYSQQFPLASHSVLHDCYVDDILAGADSVSEILKLKEELIELLSCGGLQLSKWNSNCWPILSADNSHPISLDLEGGNVTKVLGLVWNPCRDIFTFKISVDNQSSPTKRKLLSEVAKIFDPMGFLAPSTILLKIMFQELWVHKDRIGWDDLLPSDVAEKWVSYRKDLPCCESVQISRRCFINSAGFDLIGFSDASEKAYSAVVYARSISEDGLIEVHLVAAKTRVAPVKQLTIPRLELCGALLLCRLLKLIRSSLDLKPVHTFAFCDSQIVLAWLSSSPRRWNTFVANRASEILDSLPRSMWHHIRSEENPADCASRGIEPRKLLNLRIWWDGPAWLSQDLCHWPITKNTTVEDIPEERKNFVAVIASTAVEDSLNDLAAKISSWTRLIRIVSFIRRFVHNCRFPSEDRLVGFLSSVELLNAKQDCIRWAQREFSPEIHSLNSDQHVSNRSKISSLSPFLDLVGLLRVGGRIGNAPNVSFSMKHPIILPKGHPVTRLILWDAHVRYLHAGVSELFSLVRQEYWIIGSRNLIRKIVHDCVKCFRLRQTTSTQLMGNLPSARLSPCYAFAHTGCDYAGPITLRLCRGRKSTLTKGYFAIFVCMETKAIHLEAVSDLSTDAFLAALRRFIARRGKCNTIYSDNGTNFKGAARQLSEVYQTVRSRERNELVSAALATEGIKWEFIPPHSPHFGGLWEAGVKCVKQHLRRVIGNTILTFEEMSTLLAQIEAILNSRPICAISDTDLNPLTPSHFLIGRPYTALAEPNYLELAPNRLGRWELVQNMAQGFWRRWHLDYLTSLQQRPKWRKITRDFVVGDLVVIKEPDLPPTKWSLGRVEDIHPGKDGHVRVVSVRTRNIVLKRPITKLALLPCS